MPAGECGAHRLAIVLPTEADSLRARVRSGAAMCAAMQSCHRGIPRALVEVQRNVRRAHVAHACVRSSSSHVSVVQPPRLGKTDGGRSIAPRALIAAHASLGQCDRHRLYSSVVERQSCKLKVLGSIPSGGFCEPSGERGRRASPRTPHGPREYKILEAGLEPAISSLGGKRLIH